MKRLTEEKVMMYDLALEDRYTARSIRDGLIFERIADRELEAEASFIAEEESGRELLKREIRAQALLRLELSARTAEEFKNVTDEWDRLDRNRERRERYHEVSRGDVPLEYDATSYVYEKITDTFSINSHRGRSVFHPLRRHRGRGFNIGQQRTMEYNKNLFENGDLQKISEDGLLLVYNAGDNKTYLTELT